MKKLFKTWPFMAILASVMLFSTPSMAQEKLTIQGSRGKLAAILQKPEMKQGERVPMMIIMHGFGGKKESPLFDQLVKKLTSQGIATIRFDFNGHGESEGDFQYMTVPNEIEDATCIFNYVRSLDYVSCIGVLGHSQGGVVAAMLSGQLGGEIACAVLMAPAAVLRDDAIRGSTFGKQYNPLDPPEYVELFGKNRLGRDYIKTAFSLPIYETAANYHGSLCVIHGTGDQVVPYTYGLRFYQQSAGAEMYTLDGEDHGFSKNQDHATTLATDFIVRKLK